MNSGIDIGYDSTKVVTENRPSRFPSIVGTPEQGRFSLNGSHKDVILTVNGRKQLIGEGAIHQSRFINRREDRRWIESDEYYSLMLAAFSELTPATFAEMRIVTGLPVSFWQQDMETLKSRFMGDHRIEREGRKNQTIRVTSCVVIPQPFGPLAYATFNERGEIQDRELAEGRIGVIVVGGKTTELLSVNKLSEIGKETASVDVGGWDVVRGMRDYLADRCPELDLNDHEIVEAIKSKEVKYYGETVSLTEPLNEITQPLSNQIIAEASKLWNSGARLDTILAAGGGVHLLGRRFVQHYKHTRVIENPVYSTALGYWKLAQRK